MAMLPTCWLEGLGPCSKPSAAPTVVTRVLTGQVVRDVAVRSVGAQPPLAVRTTTVPQIHLGLLLLPSICEHGHRQPVLASNLKGQPVHRERISIVGGLVLNRALASDGRLHILAEQGEHRQKSPS